MVSREGCGCDVDGFYTSLSNNRANASEESMHELRWHTAWEKREGSTEIAVWAHH